MARCGQGTRPGLIDVSGLSLAQLANLDSGLLETIISMLLAADLPSSGQLSDAGHSRLWQDYPI